MLRITTAASLIASLASCGGATADPTPTSTAPTAQAQAEDPRLEVVAESDRQWTGVAVTRTGRVFVSYPRWSDDVPVSVARLEDGAPRPFPNEAWNAWREGDSVADHWVAVQSVVADGAGRVWVLDTGNPRFGGVLEGAAKLVAFDPETGAELSRVSFAPPAIGPSSYLNDVRFDVERQRAYLTDSGDGAIVVVDLESGEARRLLDDHDSTQAEADLTVRIDGQPWLQGGQPPRIHADGVALDAQNGLLYYQCLTGRRLFRVPVAALEEGDAEAAAAIEVVATEGPADGLLHGPDGRVWITSLETSSLIAYDPADGAAETLVSDPRLAWPDSLAAAPDGSVYVTTSQIHRTPNPPAPYRLLRFLP